MEQQNMRFFFGPIRIFTRLALECLAALRQRFLNDAIEAQFQ